MPKIFESIFDVDADARRWVMMGEQNSPCRYFTFAEAIAQKSPHVTAALETPHATSRSEETRNETGNGQFSALSAPAGEPN